VSSAFSFYLTTLLVYLGVDILAVWSLNLQYGVAGIYNFA
jgi:ABC-type branched-subunit amino acid transport system permease subunit